MEDVGQRTQRTEDGGWRMEDGGWRMEDGGWRMEDGGWRMEDGGWRMEDGGWRMEDTGRVKQRGARRRGGEEEEPIKIHNQKKENEKYFQAGEKKNMEK
jgi:hypothetical protein